MRSIFFAILLALIAPSSWAADVCGSPGAFAGASHSCCAGLVKDAGGRCQFPTCKPQGAAATVASNGVADCCFGLAPVSGVCRVPTLTRQCAILGEGPSGNISCCQGLVKQAGTGRCMRNAVAQCNPTQTASCCHMRDRNTCNCYCPSVYHQGT